MKCPNCQTENREGAIYCRSCAQPLKANYICPQCGQVNKGDSKFCDKCGKKLEFVETNILSSVEGTGTNPRKSYIACALGNAAARTGDTVLYVRASRLFETLQQSRGGSSYLKALVRLSRCSF